MCLMYPSSVSKNTPVELVPYQYMTTLGQSECEGCRSCNVIGVDNYRRSCFGSKAGVDTKQTLNPRLGHKDGQACGPMMASEPGSV